MKKLVILNLLISVSFSLNAQITFSKNGRGHTFPNPAQHVYSSGWDYKKSSYFDIKNDSLYIYINTYSEYGGDSEDFYYYHTNIFKLKTLVPKQDKLELYIESKDEDYRNTHSLEFDSQEQFEAFYAQLMACYSMEDQQIIKDYANGIVSAEEQVQIDVEKAMQEEERLALQDVNEVFAAYNKFFYTFDSKIHPESERYVTLFNTEGKELARFDRQNQSCEKMINGIFNLRAKLTSDENDPNFFYIQRIRSKTDTIGIINELYHDGTINKTGEIGLQEWTSDQGITKYYFRTDKSQAKQYFDKGRGTSNREGRYFDPSTRSITYDDAARTLIYSINGGNILMHELILMIYVSESSFYN